MSISSTHNGADWFYIHPPISEEDAVIFREVLARQLGAGVIRSIDISGGQRQEQILARVTTTKDARRSLRSLVSRLIF